MKEKTCPINIKDISIEFVEPDKAREYYANQAINRPIKQRLLNKICYDIEHGNWKVNGDTICFNKHGRLCDGQHRMLAIAKTNQGQWCIMVRNIPEDTVPTKDTGVARSPGDVFALNEIKDANLKASIVRMSRSFGKGFVTNQGPNGIGAYTSVGHDLSPIALMDLYLASKELYDYCTSKCSFYCKKKNLINKSYLGGLMFYLIHDKLHATKSVERFFDELYISRDSQMNIINLLRDKLIDMRIRKTNTKIKYSAKYTNALFVKTWNAYITGKDKTMLKYSEKVDGDIDFI